MKLPIDPAALRDHAVDSRVERVWDRLETNLAGELGRSRAIGSSHRTRAYVAAALAAGFAAGVGVSNWPKTHAPSTPLAEHRATPASESAAAPREAAAAGRSEEALGQERRTPAESSTLPKANRRPDVGSVRRDARSDAPQAAPPWVVACANYDYDTAYELLEAQGAVASALQQATNDQRLCIASGSRQKNQSELAKVALQGVADDSADPDRAAIAAAQLARIYEDEGNVDEQRRYEQLKEIRSKGRLLTEPALCEKIKVQAEVGAHRTVLELARQYENQYPSGTCSANVQALEAHAKQKLAEVPLQDTDALPED